MKKQIIFSIIFVFIFSMSVTAVDINECGVLDEEGETYELQNDIETDDDCFIIEADDITFDCNDHHISGPGDINFLRIYGSYGIYVEEVGRINIKNCEISGFHYGIHLQNSNSNVIKDNTANRNGWGIYLSGSNSNIIEDNTANENLDMNIWRVPGGVGIYLRTSNLNMITNNHIENNEGMGIGLVNSNSNTIRHNTRSGIFLDQSDSNIIEDNIVNENEYYGIYLYNSNLNIITNNNIENRRYGILLSGDSNIIEDNHAENNWYGILLSGSENSINSNIFCYNDRSDIEVTGDNNEFIYNQCDNIEGVDIACIPCDVELERHEIELNPGWNLISSYIVPYFNDMESIFNKLIRQNILEIVKDGNGRFYIPANNFNNIDEWVSTEGYWVKVNEPTTLTIIGEERTPLIIQLHEGWNTIAYPRNGMLFMEDIIENVFEPLRDNLVMFKDDKGRFYLPEYDFNNIREVEPGQGYMIKVTEDSVLNFDVVFNHVFEG